MTTELTNAVTALNDVTQKHEQLNTQYQGTHDALASNSKAMTDWQTQQGTVELTDQNGNKHPTPTLKTLVEQAQSVNPHPHAMTKAQFDALRDIRKQQYAGSGFVEWGKQLASSQSINEGLWERVSESNALRLGAGYQASGASKSSEPLVSVDGVLHHISQVSNTDFGFNNLMFPHAPDGTKTYDLATGTVTQHTNAEVAFASEIATSKVITSRKDLVFLESWHEKIADKDVVYPLGNVQFGASSYEGVTLLNNLVAQSYSAFGEWDENTKGYGVKWSSLTDAQKVLFLSEPEHNIYFDPKANAYIQVRYRIRVVEGIGDEFDYTYAYRGISRSWRPKIDSANVPFFNVRGQNVLSDDYYDSDSTSANGYFNPPDNSQRLSINDGDFEGLASKKGIGHNNRCLAVPIALVQRMNQGAYHPVYNPMGCLSWWDGVGRNSWYALASNAVTSESQCFDVRTGEMNYPDSRSGNLGNLSGRSDQYEFYDAIYAGQVEDLRLNARKLNVNQLREESMRKAVAGEMRGKGKVPFTVVTDMGLHISTEYHANNATRIEFSANTARYTSKSDKIPRNQTTDIPYFGYLVGKTSGLMYSVSAVQKNESGLDRVYIPNYDYRAEAATENLGWYLVQGAYHNYDTKDFHSLHDLPTLPAEFDSLPWIDIVGDPERIAATFPNGVVGQWVPLIPDGAHTVVDLNRKSNVTSLTSIFTQDNGATWSTDTQTVSSTSNQITQGAQPAERIRLLTYEVSSNFTGPSTNSVVVGDVGNVWAGNDARVNFGNRLQSSFSGEIGTTVAYTTNRNVPVDGYALLSAGYVLMPDEFPSHVPLPNFAGIDGNSGVKALPTITEKNGLYYLQLHGAELKYKELGWGDDQTIPIVDGENVKTDLNGNTVKVFCHHSQIPLGIAHNG
ncbi:hypothetical protein J8L98_22015 [Pseudoalteromonas sp. MMG013]|uniref:hypothetical protein n=1 Tax=Pseudoalteromonas sp. MMG013 TaxID=2822687 RepID=UPI001B36A513|nr:hypothetical protein [Pseudoalteromonas sp. MMG013]MBQ4864371.1 hypothetical protein [Pseudoalteromonas sp. MMG013]